MSEPVSVPFQDDSNVIQTNLQVQAVPVDISIRCLSKMSNLVSANELLGITKGVCRTRLDLNDSQDITLSGQKVDLCFLKPPISLQDIVAL